MFPLQHLFSSLKAVVCWRYLQINPVFNFIPAISWMENIRVKREKLMDTEPDCALRHSTFQTHPISQSSLRFS